MKRFGLRLIVLVLLTTVGCRPTSLYFIAPSGPPEYKLGWEDGCDTGLAASGNAIGKFAYGFKKRPEFGDNEIYKSAWNEGFTYCRFSLDAVEKNSPYN
jgi:hypothetical protein